MVGYAQQHQRERYKKWRDRAEEGEGGNEGGKERRREGGREGEREGKKKEMIQKCFYKAQSVAKQSRTYLSND